MSNMNRKSLDPGGEHVSPLGDSNRTDIGYENLKVRLIKWPDETTFKRLVFKASTATRGNDIDLEEYDEQVVEDAFSGGLNQCLEWDTLVFEISGCSRGLTHELVRTRKASFAQQSMRHTNMGNAAMRMPVEIDRVGNFIAHITAAKYPTLTRALGWPTTKESSIRHVWETAVNVAREAYQVLCDADVPFQDARTVLPIATETYIIAEYPVSEFLATYNYRACAMFYPEMVELFHLMREAVIEKCGWLEPYVKISCEKTAPRGDYAHVCTYQGWERVEGHCPLAWAKEDNRVWKSRKFRS